MSKVQSIIKRTFKASGNLRTASSAQIRSVLNGIAKAIDTNTLAILKANKKDIANYEANNPKIDRLLLNEHRLKAIGNSISKVAKLTDPTGKILEKKILYNGLLLEKQTVPLGVVGAIYESRPNVTFDIAALCIRSRNAALLKGSKEAEHTNRISVKLIKAVLKENKIHPDAVNLLPSERASVKDMFTATKYIDVIIPRGSDSLIKYVRANSRVPVIETGAGVVHIYIEKEANLSKAVSIVVNAKTTRPSVCNAVDTIVIDEAIAPLFLQQLQTEFNKFPVEIYADKKSYALLKGYAHLHKASLNDFGREFLSLKCAVKIVKNLEEALAHIQKYSTRHSESIVSENKKQCQRFLKEVDAAVVYSNASTRFTDGEVFELGAEIGISTQKLHARGPFALEKLVTEKWIVKGNGQTR
ncbi:MAG: glutamate-5-semialdehyde dehydrogenase [Sphingobacteriales bacterium]|nr:glutamate-5-semialdehyde dehydrogenase [Sphingobacteriales bacterium]